MKRTHLTRGSLLLAACLATPVLAVDYDEAVDGDLSDTFSSPTFLGTLDFGSNTVAGVVGGFDPSEDFTDAFSFTVAPTEGVNELLLTSYVATGGNTASSFALYSGLNADSQIGNFGSFGPADIGSELLAIDLGPGDYTFEIFEGTINQSYVLDLIVGTFVPPPPPPPVTVSNFSGDTTGGPTFNRPFASFNGLSTSGTDVPYEVTPVFVEEDGTYTVNTATESGYDGFVLLYDANGLDPLNPLANGITGDDDGPSGTADSEFSFDFVADTQYFIVQTGFGNSDFGTYTGTVTGPGAATFALIPEPASLGLLAAAGFGLLRRRAA